MHTPVANGSFSGLISHPWEAKQKITSFCISADRLFFSSGNSHIKERGEKATLQAEVSCLKFIKPPHLPGLAVESLTAIYT